MPTHCASFLIHQPLRVENLHLLQISDACQYTVLMADKNKKGMLNLQL